MTEIVQEKLNAALRQYAKALRENFSLPIEASPEDQLKSPVQALLRAAGQAFHLAVDSRTETQVHGLGGRPDLGVTVRKLLCGHIELKAPGIGARTSRFTGENKKQWERFKALPNLIYTDGNEWALYRTGQLKGDLVRFDGDVTIEGMRALGKDATDALELLLRDFLNWEPITPANAPQLAESLAPLCRILREEVLASLANADSALSLLEKEWQRYLFPDTDQQQFADAYAQTLTYALLLAKFSGVKELSVDSAVKALSGSHGLLAQTLRILADEQARPEIILAFDLLVRVINAVDVAAIKDTRGDPWLYFYEYFLAEYDPKLRKDRGVYYTPVEVVQCQINLVAELLRDKFGKTLTFADEGVVFLDPCVGTGTYPLAAIRDGLDRASTLYGEGSIGGAATQAANNMHAFEILVGPYAVAHLRLSREIQDAGGSFPEKGMQVFLTDTLESPKAEPPAQQDLLHKKLTEEHLRASEIKDKTRIMVCMGNPPYDRQQRTLEEAKKGVHKKGGWVRFGDTKHKLPALLEDFLSPLQDAGLGVHAKNLYNDYVYFWRWAIWKVFETSDNPGIVSFITASSYLRGPGFLGMRQKMREAFDDLWIIDLEGDNLGARKTDNVFAIQTPVAIAVGVRYGAPKPDSPARVWYHKVEGTEAEKLAALAAVRRRNDLPWRACLPGSQDPFLPHGDSPYFSWPLLTNVFPWQHSGVETKRRWVIGETPEVLRRRWKSLLDSPGKQRAALFRESRDRKIDRGSPDFEGKPLPALDTLRVGREVRQLVRYAFRSFDRQWTIPDPRLSDYLRPPLWLSHGSEQVFLTSLLTTVPGDGPAAVVCVEIPDRHHFRGSFGGKDVIPLWRDSNATQPNVVSELRELLETRYKQQISGESIFAYAYAVLFCPGYVHRFWDELSIPGPRLPLTKDYELFKRAEALGKKLVWLHTFGQRMVPRGHKHGVVPQGKARCTKGVPSSPDKYPRAFEYIEATRTLHVGEGEFAPVDPAVWNFSVSGFEVVRSWLRYRMKEGAGKKSSELDKIREERWPNQFTIELLEILWVLEASVALYPELEALLDDILAGNLFTEDELPKATPEERKPPLADEEEASQEEWEFDE